MPLLKTDEQWRAAIEGTDRSIDFWMPVGATVGQATYRAWSIWSLARAPGSNDPDHPVPRQGLTITKLAVVMAELPAIEAAWSEAA